MLSEMSPTGGYILYDSTSVRNLVVVARGWQSRKWGGAHHGGKIHEVR